MSKPLVSSLWGCGESVNPPKLNIQEVQGALSFRPKGDPGPLPIFQDFYFCQVTTLKMRLPPHCIMVSLVECQQEIVCYSHSCSKHNSKTMLNSAGQVVYTPVIPQGVMAQQGLVTQAIPGTVQLHSTPQQAVAAPSMVPVIHGSTPISHIGIPSSVTSSQHQTVTSLAYATAAASNPGDEYDEMNELLNKRKPKRGVLPKHATNIMRSWLFQHIVVSFLYFL